MAKTESESEIYVLEESDYDDFLRLQADAYPGIGMNLEQELDDLRERFKWRAKDQRVKVYGARRNGRMAGGMRLHDFTMNLRGRLIPCGGLGGVAVHLEEKRKRIAGDMVNFYLDHYRERDYPMAVLWPFRPDFYRKMGFGYGGPKYRYEFAPAALPDFGDKSRVRHLTADDIPALTACYDRIQERTNGLLDEIEHSWEVRFTIPKPNKFAGFFDGSELRGFMVYWFKKGTPGNFLSNDMEIDFCFYENPAALHGLLSFLYSQRDQVRRVVFNSPDPELAHAVSDPRNGSDRLIPAIYHETATCGTGIMYRVLRPRLLFKTLDASSFGRGWATIAFELEDGFYEEGNETFTVDFDNGEPTVDDSAKPDVRIKINVADFSSLVIGSISLRKLHEYGLAEIDKFKMIETVDTIFGGVTPPYCITAF